MYERVYQEAKLCRELLSHCKFLAFCCRVVRHYEAKEHHVKELDEALFLGQRKADLSIR